jgi:hypothetical protein
LQALSAKLNRAAGVTGLLLFDSQRFIQALEGDEEAVVATMGRISRNRSHDTIRYLAHDCCANRQFGDWSMQFRRTPDGCCSNDFIKTVMESVDGVSDPRLRASFIGFASLGTRRPKGYVCTAGG